MYRHVIWDFDGTLIVFGHGVGLEGHRAGNDFCFIGCAGFGWHV